jgi:hypothetical protein
MHELTTEEYNFLRWMFEQNQISELPSDKVNINIKLMAYQQDLYESIQKKLYSLSSY